MKASVPSRGAQRLHRFGRRSIQPLRRLGRAGLDAGRGLDPPEMGAELGEREVGGRPFEPVCQESCSTSAAE